MNNHCTVLDSDDIVMGGQGRSGQCLIEEASVLSLIATVAVIVICFAVVACGIATKM